MLLHCAKRLAAKLPHDRFRNPVTASSQDERTPLGDWHGHLLLMDQRRCVLFFSGLRAAQFADLGRWHQELFLATLAALIPPSFWTHPGFIMVSTRRMKEWNDEDDRTETGNSLAIRVPKLVAEKAGLRARDSVEIQARNGTLVVRPHLRRVYGLEDLLKRITPRNVHEEVDFSEPVGR